jgi:hypothetical protein
VKRYLAEFESLAPGEERLVRVYRDPEQARGAARWMRQTYRGWAFRRAGAELYVRRAEVPPPGATHRQRLAVLVKGEECVLTTYTSTRVAEEMLPHLRRTYPGIEFRQDKRAVVARRVR